MNWKAVLKDMISDNQITNIYLDKNDDIVIELECYSWIMHKGEQVSRDIITIELRDDSIVDIY